MIYLDTSVLAAYYCPEALSRRVQKLLSDVTKPALSDLTEVELYSAVAKKIRAEQLSSVDGHRILAKFSAHLDADLFNIVTVEKHHWRLARGWIGLFTTPLRTLDALHLSIASAEELKLVTADRLLYKAAESLEVPARLISDN